MCRFAWVAVLASAALAFGLAPAAAAETPSDPADAPEPLELHAVQARDGPLHRYVEQTLSDPGAASSTSSHEPGSPETSEPLDISPPEPASGAASAPASGGAGAIPPASPAGNLLRGALVYLLAVGGGLGGALVGWRHLHQRNVLDHPTRMAILALVRAQPGVHLHALARATGLPAQQAAYHLHTLERMGLIASQKVAGRRCYHEASAAGEVRRALLEASRTPGPAAQQVLEFIASNPGASQSEVARQLGMLPGTARWHLRRLAEQGALVEAREGKALTYRPATDSPGGAPARPAGPVAPSQ